MRKAFAFISLVWMAAAAWGLEPISADDALRLVAHQGVMIEQPEIQREEYDGVPRYRVTGTSDGAAVAALVDARASRVLEIRNDGDRVYTCPGVVVVGHRGTVKFAPENTIAAFNAAIDHGADLLEMDVRETKDGQLVIMHDQSVARTTDGRGDVAALTLAEIRALDAGSWFGDAFKGEPVPTFQEALAATEGRALPDIDFKAGDPQKVVDVVREAGLAGKVTLYCGDWDKLKATLAIDPGFIIRPTAPQGQPGLEEVLKALDPPIVNIDWRYFSEELVRDIHLAAKKAFVNTMGREDNAASLTRAIDAGADYIQTDHLDVLLPLLHARGLHK